MTQPQQLMNTTKPDLFGAGRRRTVNTSEALRNTPTKKHSITSSFFFLFWDRSLRDSFFLSFFFSSLSTFVALLNQLGGSIWFCVNVKRMNESMWGMRQRQQERETGDRQINRLNNNSGRGQALLLLLLLQLNAHGIVVLNEVQCSLISGRLQFGDEARGE